MSGLFDELRDEIRGRTGMAITAIVLMAFGILAWVCGNHILEPLEYRTVSYRYTQTHKLVL